ncbi:MAG: CopG family transcriptional regulator, partial [Bdellovibrionales bacterium]
MRTIVDLPDEQVKALDLIGRTDKVSRAELVRQAVHLFLEHNKKKKRGEIIGPDIRGMVKEGDPRYFMGMSTEDWIKEMRGETGDARDVLYKNWSKLSAK